MSFEVAKILHLDVNVILNEWSTSMLLVTAGYYLNDRTQERLAEYKELSSDIKGSQKRPNEYIIKFM